MASKIMYAAILGFIFVAVLPSIAIAKEIVVGDDSGWTIKFDYQTWAMGKDFLVGDTLVFKYPVGVHNVFKVDGPAFRNCSVPPPSQALTSGNDRITLATPGRKWYICGVGQHCALGGQKLAITVLPAPDLSPSSPPSVLAEKQSSYTSDANTVIASGCRALMMMVAGVVAVAAMAFLAY
ncbi:hypothetical protein ACLOJK_005707 [Asimina triloba]